MSEKQLTNANFSNVFDDESFEVLIVDDIPENLLVLSHMLDERGIDVSVAPDGQKALETVDFSPPDLILLDIAMPGMDGYEVCKHLKDNPKTAYIPVIFLTAKIQPEDIIKGFELGAVDYVTKPFHAPELISRVFTHLRLKKSADIIANQNNELRELNATKDKFFSIIAHDLKNPFHTLIGFSDMLARRHKSMDEEKTDKYIHMIHQAAKSGFELLENLLHWSRSQTGRLKHNPRKFSLYDLVEDTVELLFTSAKNKDIALMSEIHPDTTVFGDVNMITTVIRNLISNAIKFTEQGGRIVISDTDRNDKVEVTVADTGIGMKEEDKNKLFKISIHHTTPGTGNEKGTGLGLILCKEFVETHHGKIWVESEYGKGSEFKFTLPKEPVESSEK